MDQDENWRACRPRPWPHCVRWGPSSPSPKLAQSPISAHICCGQMALWIKMPLGMEVNLSPGDFVLDGDRPSSPFPPERAQPPTFGPCLLWPNGCMYQDITTEVGLSLCDIVLDGDPAPPSLKGHSYPRNFRPMSVVAKRLDRLMMPLVAAAMFGHRACLYFANSGRHCQQSVDIS